MSTTIKKISALICAAMLIISISACGEKNETKESGSASETNSVVSYSDSSAEATTAASTEIPTEATTIAADEATTAAKAEKEQSKTETTDNSIVGVWEYESGGFTYTFKEDGTGTYDVAGNVMKFTYTADGTKLKITYEGSPAMELEYELSGDTLNVKDSTGNDTIYKRK